MKILNRKAQHNYQFLEKIEAGIVLTGSELKSLLAGQASLEDAYVKIKQGEAYLINAYIHPYRFSTPEEVDPRRTRKLLLHRKELEVLEAKMKQRQLTMIPISCYNRGSFVKVELALARGKKQYEHREDQKRRDLARDTELELGTN